MTLSIRPAADIDKPAIRTLLAMHKLPLDGLFSGDSQYFVALDNGMFVGCAGFEYYQPDALLRSVAIAPDYQHCGAGSQLVDFMIGHAKKRNTEQIVLLTSSASGFFERKGFISVKRSEIKNLSMLKSPEFAFVCCNSAATMIYKIDKQ